MSIQLNPADTDRLVELQERCDSCREAIVRESSVIWKTTMEKVCEKCEKVRQSIPDLIQLRLKLQGLNAS